MGLPKVNRLKNRRDFHTVYQQGIRRHSSHLILKAYAVPDENKLQASRIGISIGKKVSKKAVVRNRIKRQIKGAIREILPWVAPGWKMIIIVKPGAIECKYEHFLRELNQLLKETKIINGY